MLPRKLLHLTDGRGAESGFVSKKSQISSYSGFNPSECHFAAALGQIAVPPLKPNSQKTGKKGQQANASQTT